MQNNGHAILFDNFFSFYNLFEAFSQLHLRAIVTLRINRFANPPLMSEADLKKKGRGACFEVSSNNDDVGVIRWFDNKCVKVGSNLITLGTVSTAERWNKKKRLTKK